MNGIREDCSSYCAPPENGEYSNCRQCEHGRGHIELETVFCLATSEFIDGDCECFGSDTCCYFECEC